MLDIVEAGYRLSVGLSMAINLVVFVVGKYEEIMKLTIYSPRGISPSRFLLHLTKKKIEPVF